MIQRRNRPSIFLPLLLIAGGVLLFLYTIKGITVGGWDLVWRLWPLLFIIGGLDGLYRQEGFAGPLVSIGLGTVIQLSNLGYLPASSWMLLLRLWPVLLIAAGVDLLIIRRSPISMVIGILAGLVLIAGISLYAVNYAGPGDTFTIEPISQVLGDASRADVKIEAVGADLNLAGGAGPKKLMEGQLTVTGSERSRSSYSVSGQTATYQLALEPSSMAVPSIFGADPDRWTLKIASKVPIALKTSLVFGQQTVNLQETAVQNLKSDTVFGRSEIVLPGNGVPAVDASVVFGELVIRVPHGTRLAIQAGRAFTSLSFPEDFTQEGDMFYSPGAGHAGPADIKVSAPFGSLRVEYQ
jgi:hypothetical protein